MRGLTRSRSGQRRSASRIGIAERMPNFARLVAGRGDDAAVGGAADDDRLAAQFGVVALFDRRVERIHVDVQDAARIHHRL